MTISHMPARGASGIFRRIGAGCYDALLVGGLLMVSVGLATYLTRPAGTGTTLAAFPHRLLYQTVAMAVIAAYYGLCWTSRGETLGMKAWRLRLLCVGGPLPSWRHVLVRLLLAVPLWLAPLAGLLMFMRHAASAWMVGAAALPLAISLAAAWSEGISLHDRASATRVVLVPRS
jgi:uncharacterized RDD family membrane protein YckC